MVKFDFKTNFRLWLCIVGSALLVLGAAYGMVQQATRLSANDIPRNTGEELRSIANDNKSAQLFLQAFSYNIDLAKDSGPFIIITDKSKKVVASNSELDGNPKLLPPAGVFKYAAAHGSDAVTWQPKAGIRVASYVTAFNNGYIVTGQSLKPFEDRENKYLVIAAAAWVLTALWSAAVLFVALNFKRPATKPKKRSLK